MRSSVFSRLVLLLRALFELKIINTRIKSTRVTADCLHVGREIEKGLAGAILLVDVSRKLMSMPAGWPHKKKTLCVVLTEDRGAARPCAFYVQPVSSSSGPAFI